MTHSVKQMQMSTIYKELYIYPPKNSANLIAIVGMWFDRID